MKKYLTIPLFLISLSSYASSISFDIGQTKTLFNRFAVPNIDANRISLSSDDTLTSYRVTGYFDMENNNQLYILIAPLETSYEFISTKNFEYDGENFSAGGMTKVNYKFNSYRVGYLWRWLSGNANFWFGAVGKIRDANIQVIQKVVASEKSSGFDNIGFVPLAALGFELLITDSFSVFSHTDALGASQGSAYDSQIELRYKVDTLSLSIGRRILGGGANNESVYNFAQFDTNYLRLSYLY